MWRGVRWYLVGFLVPVALTGCKTGWFEEREPWRREAEMSCLKTGTVKESASVALLGPISGPGMCGADFPLKVSGLGEGGPLGYADEAVRPPADVPQRGPASPRPPTYRPPPHPSRDPSAYPSKPPFATNPNYPADTRLPPRQDYPPQPQDFRAAPSYRTPPQSQGSYPPNAPFAVNPDYPADTRLPPRGSYPPQPPQGGQGGPGGYEPPPPDEDAVPSRSYRTAPNGPVSLRPPGREPAAADQQGDYQPSLPPYGTPRSDPPRDYQPPLPPYGAPPSDPPRDRAPAYPSPANADEPPYRPPPRDRAPPFPQRYPGSSEVVPMSPSRAGSARMASLATTASVSPPATLACPIVSALDRWISDAVQPAALKWFGQPVTGIRQISAYSCRGMNGDPNAHISEHAFGNALDISAFILADGRTVTVEQGWRGAPEEQGFLHDVQGAACDVFTTVLAPGSNVYHYNHIHVDLMRRASGRRICEPGSIPGDQVAARVRARYARSRDSGVTGAIPAGRRERRQVRYSAYDREDRSLPDAVPGED